MTAVWVIVGSVAVFFALLYAFSVGHNVGEARANRHWRRLSDELNAELDTEWRQLFTELHADHEDELASRDATIYLLRRDNKAEFLNGQTFRADRQENDL